jgi:N-acetylglucosaminyldiphosphoundecaprenol N-acetyl-beta-D-mannosaminyltransferase
LPPPAAGERVNILGVGIDPLNLTAAVARVEGWISARTASFAIFRDVHGIMLCQDDPALMTAHGRAGLVGGDGMPLVWLARLQRGARVGRVYGPDFTRAFVSATAGKGYRHYFYGATPEVIEMLTAQLRKLDPGLVVAGVNSPPFRPLTPAEDAAVVAEINQALPDVVWVGLSTPKQELWMTSMLGRLTAPAMLGVGAAFDFVAGTKPQAPAWIRHSGFEWLFRLATEPKRLGGRYARHLPRFVVMALAQTLGLKRFDPA